MTAVLVSAGDASGDRHAAELVCALRERAPELSVRAYGGDELARAGCEILVDQREAAIGGFLPVLGAARHVAAAMRTLVRALDRPRPALVVLVDYAGFNLRLALFARRRRIPVLYYVAPQVWAWRRYRIRSLARRAGRVAAIFPFEPAVYRGTGLRVDFVGHPLVDRLRACAELPRERARAALGLDPEAPLVLLLPGSRSYELRNHLPLQLEAARRLHAGDPRLHFAVVRAPSLARERIDALLRAASLPPQIRVDVIEGHPHEAARAAEVAIAKPGTVTLELAVLDCPMVVVGRASAVEVALARRLLHVPSLAMPNLIAGAPVVPELLQREARPEPVARAAAALLEGPAREAQRRRLARVRAALGSGGAAGRAAEIALEMMDEGART